MQSPRGRQRGRGDKRDGSADVKIGQADGAAIEATNKQQDDTDPFPLHDYKTSDPLEPSVQPVATEFSGLSCGDMICFLLLG